MNQSVGRDGDFCLVKFGCFVASETCNVAVCWVQDAHSNLNYIIRFREYKNCHFFLQITLLLFIDFEQTNNFSVLQHFLYLPLKISSIECWEFMESEEEM